MRSAHLVGADETLVQHLGEGGQQLLTKMMKMERISLYPKTSAFVYNFCHSCHGFEGNSHCHVFIISCFELLCALTFYGVHIPSPLNCKVMLF